jgi:hypothetical protein
MGETNLKPQAKSRCTVSRLSFNSLIPLNKTNNKMMTFSEAIQSLPSFISEMQADWEMVYDWMMEMCEIDEFSDAETAELAITYAQYAD